MNKVCLQRAFLFCYLSYFSFRVHSSDNPLGFQRIWQNKKTRDKYRAEKLMSRGIKVNFLLGLYSSDDSGTTGGFQQKFLN